MMAVTIFLIKLVKPYWTSDKSLEGLMFIFSLFFVLPLIFYLTNIIFLPLALLRDFVLQKCLLFELGYLSNSTKRKFKKALLLASSESLKVMTREQIEELKLLGLITLVSGSKEFIPQGKKSVEFSFWVKEVLGNSKIGDLL
jgi:hypothetical protein